MDTVVEYAINRLMKIIYQFSQFTPIEDLS